MSISVVTPVKYHYRFCPEICRESLFNTKDSHLKAFGIGVISSEIGVISSEIGVMRRRTVIFDTYLGNL